MRRGLLWFDDSPKRDLVEKIGRAVERYRERMGCDPDTCCIHPALVNGQAGQVIGGVRVAALPTVLPHHFWVGCEETAQARAVPVPAVDTLPAGAALLRAVAATPTIRAEEALELAMQLELSLG